MKVLFLDVDGVLNTASLLESSFTCMVVGDEFVDRVRRIREETNCKIVLSSSWRCDPNFFEHIQTRLSEASVSIFDTTPQKLTATRAMEINLWLKSFPDEVERYAIVDDDMSADLKDGSFFRTEFATGLTESVTTAIIGWLNQ